MIRQLNEIDWFWPAVVVIVFIVMFFNTLRDRDNNRLIETCLKQGKAAVYEDGKLKRCEAINERK